MSLFMQKLLVHFPVLRSSCCEREGRLLYFNCAKAQEFEIRSLYHFYSIKTKSSRCNCGILAFGDRSDIRIDLQAPVAIAGMCLLMLCIFSSLCRWMVCDCSISCPFSLVLRIAQYIFGLYINQYITS